MGCAGTLLMRDGGQTMWVTDPSMRATGTCRACMAASAQHLLEPSGKPAAAGLTGPYLVRESSLQAWLSPSTQQWPCSHEEHRWPGAQASAPFRSGLLCTLPQQHNTCG